MCKCHIDTTPVAGEKMGCCFKIAKSGEMGYNKNKIDLKKYMGRGKKMFDTDAGDYVKELGENDRV